MSDNPLLRNRWDKPADLPNAEDERPRGKYRTDPVAPQRYRDHFDRNPGMSDDFKRSIRKYRHSQLRDKDAESAAPIDKGIRTKLIVSGGVSERYRYAKPLRLGPRAREVDPETGELLNSRVTVDADGNPLKRDQRETGKRANARRSKMELRRLVLANFSDRDKFLTLTFRDGSVSDVTDVAACNKAFDRYLKRLRRNFPDVKYCRVIEFQDSSGRGAVHYHCILSLPYVPYDKLSQLWGNGFVGINAIEHVDNVGAYIQKYMAKDFDDARLAGKKAYTCGGDLTRPIVLYGDEAEDMYDQFLRDKLPTFKNSYPSDWQGEVQYDEYNERRF